MTLQVDFELASPLCVDMYGVLFDSLLLNALYGNTGKKSASLADRDFCEAETRKLFEYSPQGLIYASFGAISPEAVQGSDFMCKRFDVPDALVYADADTVVTNKGKFKNAKSVVQTLAVNEVSFRFRPADKAACVQAIEQVLGIGKHVARGFGAVAGFKIDVAPESVWQRVWRPIPFERFSGKPERVQYRTHCAPFWDMRDAQICVVDGVF